MMENLLMKFARSYEQKKNKEIVLEDEYIRKNIGMDDIARSIQYLKKGGTVTAANASGINDGVRCFINVLCKNRVNEVEPLARIVGWGAAAVDPAIMGTGPIPN